VVAVERLGIWQLHLGCGTDSLQFHGGAGSGERARCVIENSAMAPPAFLRCAGGPRRNRWLHNGLYPSGARRLVAIGFGKNCKPISVSIRREKANRFRRVICGFEQCFDRPKNFKKKLVRPSRLPLERNSERQMPSFRRSKKNQKSEKKACQRLRNLISLPKPNQTNGETND
jgi:hypothetical protein